jgi:predicted Rossmann-fold nucleotide-binding protein
VKAIICGSRNHAMPYEDWLWLDKLKDSLPIMEVIEGGASGADRMARQWAINNGINVTTVPANWKAHGKAAGPIRNAQMAAMGDLVIAFPGGRGTADMVRQADARGLPVYRREQPEPIDRPGN